MEAAVINTLEYDPARCIGCGMCVAVCPHGVFEMNGRTALLVRYEACMECGACELNCPAEAIAVESGVGCAAAMIRAALTGGKETCGSADGAACCGSVAEDAASSCCDEGGTDSCCDDSDTDS